MTTWADLEAVPTPPLHGPGRRGDAAWLVRSPPDIEPPWAITAAHAPTSDTPTAWRVTARTSSTVTTTDPATGTSIGQTTWTIAFDLPATTEPEALDIVEWILSEAPTK